MKNSKIQWCDDTINPVMGCDGCELWPTQRQLLAKMEKTFAASVPSPYFHEKFQRSVSRFTELPHKDLLNRVAADLIADRKLRDGAVREIKTIIKCYAGKLTDNRGGKIKGYPRRFDEPTLFPGRVAEASRWSDLSGTRRPDKPWLDGLPRMIFLSDMGDALSRNIGFEDLSEEVIVPCSSVHGERHIWLWLTKRPSRMA